MAVVPFEDVDPFEEVWDFDVPFTVEGVLGAPAGAPGDVSAGGVVSFPYP